MAIARISGTRIAGLVTAVPENEIDIEEEISLFGGNPSQLERLKTTIGLWKRRVVPDGMTACDLAEAAVRKLLVETATDPQSIDGVFMVTQTPDYLQPGNAVLLQGRIGFPTTCAAVDLNSGCSGYVYGLWTVQALIASGGLRKVILVVGDTISRIVSAEDRALRPLFGDAASATLLEADPGAGETVFDLGTDGTRYQVLWQPGGAFREPATSETMEIRDIGEGIRRSRCHLHMDGAEIFNFSLEIGPKSVRAVLEATGWDPESVDGYVFHQANAYILSNIRRRLKVSEDKVPSATVGRFGNQSSASIPATLTNHYREALTRKPHRFILSGFGVGLSWATCAMDLPPLSCNTLLEI